MTNDKMKWFAEVRFWERVRPGRSEPRPRKSRLKRAVFSPNGAASSSPGLPAPRGLPWVCVRDLSPTPTGLRRVHGDEDRNSVGVGHSLSFDSALRIGLSVPRGFLWDDLRRTTRDSKTGPPSLLPSPPGRGRIVRCFLAMSRVSLVSGTAARTLRQRTSRPGRPSFPKPAERHSLSPGERAGVRAGVTLPTMVGHSAVNTLNATPRTDSHEFSGKSFLR